MRLQVYARGRVYRAGGARRPRAREGGRRHPAATRGRVLQDTSKTTGESHVIVTDGNGQVSTAASWNTHTKDTNDGAAGSGVWFGGSDPADAKGSQRASPFLHAAARHLNDA